VAQGGCVHLSITTPCHATGKLADKEVSGPDQRDQHCRRSAGKYVYQTRRGPPQTKLLGNCRSGGPPWAPFFIFLRGSFCLQRSRLALVSAGMPRRYGMHGRPGCVNFWCEKGARAVYVVAAIWFGKGGCVPAMAGEVLVSYDIIFNSMNTPYSTA
jgi:hypothetical protein